MTRYTRYAITIPAVTVYYDVDLTTLARQYTRDTDEIPLDLAALTDSQLRLDIQASLACGNFGDDALGLFFDITNEPDLDLDAITITEVPSPFDPSPDPAATTPTEVPTAH